MKSKSTFNKLVWNSACTTIFASWSLIALLFLISGVDQKGIAFFTQSPKIASISMLATVLFGTIALTLWKRKV